MQNRTISEIIGVRMHTAGSNISLLAAGNIRVADCFLRLSNTLVSCEQVAYAIRELHSRTK
jgi:hypothetical protein